MRGYGKDVSGQDGMDARDRVEASILDDGHDVAAIGRSAGCTQHAAGGGDAGENERLDASLGQHGQKAVRLERRHEAGGSQDDDLRRRVTGRDAVGFAAQGRSRGELVLVHLPLGRRLVARGGLDAGRRVDQAVEDGHALAQGPVAQVGRHVQHAGRHLAALHEHHLLVVHE